jgi:integrase
MSIQSELKAAGILSYLDRAQLYDLRYLGERDGRTRRFKKAIAEVSKLAHDKPGVYEARLVFLALVQPEHLRAAVSVQPYRHDGKVYLDWEVRDSGYDDDQEPRIERRRLPDLTVLSIPSIGTSAGAGMTDFLRLLQTMSAYQGTPESTLLEEIGRDLACWAITNLPGPLWAHITGLQTFWATARQTLVRKSTGLRNADAASDDSAQELEIAAFEDTVLATVANAEKSEDTSVLEAALRILSTKEGETDQETLKRWVDGYLKLKTNIQYADCHTAIIAAWQLNLIESGTAGHATAVPQTRSSYIKLISPPLLSGLRAMGGNPSTWTQEKMDATYTTLLASHQGDKRKFCSALNDFQMYCHETWGTPLVRINASDLVPPPRPRTQLIHAHEVAKAVLWFETYKDGDQRLLQICALMLRLFEQAPFRLNELAFIRLENIEIEDGGNCALIEVYPCPENGLKSDSGTRPLIIKDRTTIAKLAAWVAKRRQEGAKDGDFLFGKKSGKGLYRKSLVSATIRTALKAATGDPAMTIHALRHSYATRVLNEILLEPHAIDFNRLNQLAHDMGHVSISTTIEFYVHDFSDLLAVLCQRKIRGLVVYDSTEAERVTGKSSDALRQVPRRNGISLDQYARNHIEVSACKVELGAALDHSTWIEAPDPHFASESQSQLTLLKVWEIAKSLSADEQVDHLEVANLHDVNIGLVRQISTYLQSMGLRAQTQWNRNRRTAFGLITSAKRAMEALSFVPQDLLQLKYHGLLRKMANQVWTTELEDLAKVMDFVIEKDAVSLKSVQAYVRLFSFLKTYEIDHELLHISVQGTGNFDKLMLEMKKKMELHFEAVWQIKPEIHSTGRRRDRPDAYLQVKPSPERTDSKSCDSGGLLALLHSITLFSLLRN